MTVTPMLHGCANPRCRCGSRAATCSLWCGSPDVPADGRCLCRHAECADPGRRPGMAPARLELFPPALDPFRPERRGIG